MSRGEISRLDLAESHILAGLDLDTDRFVLDIPLDKLINESSENLELMLVRTDPGTSYESIPRCDGGVSYMLISGDLMLRLCGGVLYIEWSKLADWSSSSRDDLLLDGVLYK